MAGVTTTGFEPMTYDEVITSINDLATSTDYYGATFPTTPDSPYGVQTGILGASIVDIWQLAQEVAVQQDVDTATGIYLDYLAALRGITRLEASGSTGQLLFKGRSGTTVSQFFPVADVSARNVLTQSSLTLNRVACYTSSFTVNTLIVGDYTLNVNGTSYTFTPLSTPTEEDVLDGLLAAMVAATDFTATVTGSVLSIVYSTSSNLMYTTNTSNLSLYSVGGLVTATAVDDGDLIFTSNSLTKLVGINVNVDSVTNPQAFTEGRSEETDEELRDRINTSGTSQGTATKPAIEGSLIEIEGVTSVLINENITMVEDGNGVPAKSYETFVAGGDLDQIAQVIWDTKPAGIRTFGNVTRAVIDNNGDIQTVSFSRPDSLYAWMRVTYTINSEEVFPDEGEDDMAASVVSTGEDMYRGEDYVAGKFYGSLYQTQGMFVSNVEIAVTPYSGDSPTFQTANITVENTDDLIFDTSRVLFTTS